MIQNRIDGARKLLIRDHVRLESKTADAWYFEIKSLNNKDFYSVVVTNRGCSCTCEFGSMWGVKEKHLPCQHVLAGIGATILKVKRK